MKKVQCSNNPEHIIRDQKEGSVCEECGGNVIAAQPSREELFLESMKQRAIREAPRPKGTQGGTIKIVLCTACGAPIWRGMDDLKSKEDRVVLEEGNPGMLCQPCEAIRYRYPEIFHWVNNTSFWRRSRMGILEMFKKEGEPPKSKRKLEKERRRREEVAATAKAAKEKAEATAKKKADAAKKKKKAAKKKKAGRRGH